MLKKPKTNIHII